MSTMKRSSHQLITEKAVVFNPVRIYLKGGSKLQKDPVINYLQYKNYVPIGGNLWKLKVQLNTP